jgi:hypothetical protein
VRRIDVSNGLDVTSSSIFFPAMALTLMICGVLNLVGVVVKIATGDGGDLSSGVVLTVVLVVVGAFWGNIPFRVTATAAPGATELLARSRTLFGKREQRVALDDVTGVRISVGVYWEWVEVVQKNDAPVRVLGRMKTWTFRRTPTDATQDAARRIAEWLKVPLSA